MSTSRCLKTNLKSQTGAKVDSIGIKEDMQGNSNQGESPIQMYTMVHLNIWPKPTGMGVHPMPDNTDMLTLILIMKMLIITTGVIATGMRITIEMSIMNILDITMTATRNMDKLMTEIPTSMWSVI